MEQQPYTQPSPIPPAPPGGPYRTPAAPQPVQPRRTKSKFFTVFWALIPGAGQMYQGLMKKGVLLMSLFVAVILATALTYVGALTCILPVIWFYSFFDTVNRMNMTVEELRSQPDILFKGEFKFGSLLSGNRHVLAGSLLIALAVWLLLKGLFTNSFSNFNLVDYLAPKAARFLSDFINLMPLFILPAFCVIIGVRLITGGRSGKGKPGKTYDEYTIPTEKDDNK